MRDPRTGTYSVRTSKAVISVFAGLAFCGAATVATIQLKSGSIGLAEFLLVQAAVACDIASLWVLFSTWRQSLAWLAAATFVILAAISVAQDFGVAIASLLMLGVFVVTARLLPSTKQVFWIGSLTGLVIIVMHFTELLQPGLTYSEWAKNGLNPTDLVVYVIFFASIGLLCWIYYCKIQGSLCRLQQMETAIIRQQATLERAVKRRTAQLRRLQLEELHQMYRFSELGHLGIVLLHDIANHLTTLTIEIEAMRNRQSSESLSRARLVVDYLEQLVESTRLRMEGGIQRKQFDMARITNNVVTFLNHKAKKAGVQIEWQTPSGDWQYTGDPTDYAQIIAIIINNAIDAYAADDSSPVSSGKLGAATAKRLRVHMERDEAKIRILISDWGKGIPKHQRKYLFRPFQSSKKKGFGIGLFIAQQSAILSFQGTLRLNNACKHTEFIVELPVMQQSQTSAVVTSTLAEADH